MAAAIKPGDVVRFRLGPERDPYVGVVQRVDHARTRHAEWVTIQVQWMHATGEPGKTDWYDADDVVLVPDP